MDEQMTQISDLGLTDPQAQQDQVLAFLQQLAQLMQNGGQQAFSGGKGPIVTQDMIDALAPGARERIGLLPNQTPAGIDTQPGVMSQLGAPLDMRSANPEWMVPQGALASILAGGSESTTPGAITSYAGGKPTTYMPEIPRRQSVQAQQPETEGLGLTEQERQAAIQGYTSRGESVPAILSGTKEQPQVSATSNDQLSSLEIKQMADLASAMEAQKIPADVRAQVIEQRFPKLKALREKEKLGLFQQQKEIIRAMAPAPAGVYLDKTGTPYSPSFGEDIQKDKAGAFYRQNSPQQKILTATGMVNAHLDRTLDHLHAISKIDRNRISRYMSTSLDLLRNDPDIVALIQFLGPASAMAIANAYASSGVSMRGGVTAAMMFKDAVFSPGDDLSAVLTKMKDLALIATDQAKFINLHPNIVKASQDRVDAINKLLGETGKKGKKATAPKLPGEQRIRKTGTTQEYRLLPGAQLPEGYEVVQ